MSKLDWYYVHSPQYEFFHIQLCKSIDPAFFTPHPIFVNQSVFDEHLYKHKGEHFFSRISVKIDNIIKIIEEKLLLKNTDPFIFTDCDVIVTKYAGTILKFHSNFKEVDILFQREILTNTTVNPGCMMITPLKNVLNFFKEVRNEIINKNTMEMDSINRLLVNNENKVKYTFFSTRDVCSSHTISHATFSVYHILGNCVSKEADMAHKITEYLRMSQELIRMSEKNMFKEIVLSDL